MQHRRLGTIALATASIAVLAGCAGSSDPAASTAPSGEAEAGAFPITVEHALGETVIEQRPERVATVGYGNGDFVLSLGVVPVGMDAANYGDEDGDGYFPWTLDAIDALGADPADIALFDSSGSDPDFEGIANVAPDVILAPNSGLTDEQYDTLSEIAPVVAYPEAPYVTPWRDSLALTGEALGLEAEADAVLADLESSIDAAKDGAAWDGRTMAFFYVDPANLSVISAYSPADTRVAYFNDLGLVNAPSVEEAAAADPSLFYIDKSAENADDFSDAEIVVLYGDEQSLATLQADPLIGRIAAIQRGSVAVIDWGESLAVGSTLAAATSPTSLSIPYTLERFPALLEAAAANLP